MVLELEKLSYNFKHYMESYSDSNTHAYFFSTFFSIFSTFSTFSTFFGAFLASAMEAFSASVTSEQFVLLYKLLVCYERLISTGFSWIVLKIREPPVIRPSIRILGVQGVSGVSGSQPDAVTKRRGRIMDTSYIHQWFEY